VGPDFYSGIAALEMVPCSDMSRKPQDIQNT